MPSDFAEWLLTDDCTSFSGNIASDPSNGDFELWFLANGGYIDPAIKIASNQSEGTFLQVDGDQDLARGSTIISCPRRLIFSWPNIHSYHLNDVHSSFIPHVATRFYLMKQYLLQSCSPWWPYIRSLPQPFHKESFNTPLYYGSEDLVWIRGTNLEYAMKIREDAWRKEYNDAMQQFREKNDIDSKSNVDKLKALSWELYLWAATVMTSRSFPGPDVFSRGNYDFPTHANSEARSPVLIPGLDISNHNPYSKVLWLWDSTLCTIQNDEVIPRGSQVYNNYGPKSNAELIMGYGFSLRNNAADHYCISFSPAISTYIRITKSRRLALGPWPEYGKGFYSPAEGTERVTKKSHLLESADILESEFPAEQYIHSLHTSGDSYEFSPGFLEDFAIAVENHRERLEAEEGRTHYGNFWDRDLSRNKVHVICAIVMILQRAQLAIRKHDKDLPQRPLNGRQIDAARYRRGQLRIFEHVLGSLYAVLKSYVDFDEIDHAKSTRLFRLEHTMSTSPRRLLRDFRNVLNAGMRTRDPTRIRERGGSDFAFAIWLCGLWIIAQNRSERDYHEVSLDLDLEPRLVRWLRSLHEVYREERANARSPRETARFNNSIDGNDWFDPVRNQEQEASISAMSASYLDAIRAALEKHPQSLYNDPRINAKRLEWCLNIVRMEGVWFPHLQDDGQEKDDEWMLFLDCEPI